MDARVQLATTDAERWTYVASSLEETARSNAQTAAILERLTAQLDGHDRRIEALEEHHERAVERELERRATQDAAPAPPAILAATAAPTTVASVLNRIYNDARLAFLAGAGGGGIITALVTHIGLSWH